MEDKLYFAYGSDINLNHMKHRCLNACVVGPVALENYELLFRQDGFATIMPCWGGKVHGLLWSLPPECKWSMDMYENIRIYNRRTVTVQDGLGRELSAMAYIMDERFRQPMLPKAIYLDIIMEGYEQNGLPMTELKKAVACTVRELYQEKMRGNTASVDRSRLPKRRRDNDR